MVGVIPSNRIHRPLSLLAAILAVASFNCLRADDSAATPQAASSTSSSTSGEQAVRLDEMEVFSAPTSALTQARTDAPLDSTQPNSVISAQTINNQIAPTADYATIANIAPSVVNVETEGPGLSESKMLSMRGFQDGQYNVTYDGIPFGDANGETHHTTSYFPAKVLGGDGHRARAGNGRGHRREHLRRHDRHSFPRTRARTRRRSSPSPTGAGTRSSGTSRSTPATWRQLNGGSLVATYQYMSTDGYRTFSYLQRNTYYLKYVQPIGKNTTLTVVGNYNNIKFNNPGTATQAQINQFGRNYGLDGNPFDPNNNYYPYNYQQKQADLEYIGLKSKFGRLHPDRQGLHLRVQQRQPREFLRSGGRRLGHQVPGSGLRGTRLRERLAEHACEHGRGPDEGLRDHQRRRPGRPHQGQRLPGAGRLPGAHRTARIPRLRSRSACGASTSRPTAMPTFSITAPPTWRPTPRTATGFGALDTANSKGAAQQPGYQWLMHVDNKTFQPYADVIWKPIPKLTIEAGVKDSNFTIDLEAPVNQGTEQPDFNNYTYTNLEPHFSANYAFTPDWSGLRAAGRRGSPIRS